MGNGGDKQHNFIDCERIYDFIMQRPEISDLGVLGRLHGAFDVQNYGALLKLKNELLANDLEALQSQHNDGRGITCVRGIVSELRRGDANGAAAIAHNDWDKIANYRDVAEWLQKNEFAEKEWFISPIAE
jgi:hypothetical protein